MHQYHHILPLTVQVNKFANSVTNPLYTHATLYHTQLYTQTIVHTKLQSLPLLTTLSRPIFINLNFMSHMHITVHAIHIDCIHITHTQFAHDAYTQSAHSLLTHPYNIHLYRTHRYQFSNMLSQVTCFK